MQAVILAAGSSSRFWPLNNNHKSLFSLMGKPLILHLIENIANVGIKEIIIVQSAKRDIEQKLSQYNKPSGIKIDYIIQDKPLGTADALMCASDKLKDEFLVFYGDDFYDARDIKKIFNKKPSLLAKEVSNPSSFGVILTEGELVKDILEKTQNPPTNLVNAGGYFLTKEILKYKIDKSSRGEYEITDLIKILIKKGNFYFSKAEYWFPLSYSWDLIKINEFLMEKVDSKVLGTIEQGCKINGKVFIGKGSIIKSGTYIEGPVFIGENCQIGPNCYIRPFTTIGNYCRIGSAVELKNSIISNNSKISHMSCVLDSILGEDCAVAAGVIFSNFRFDEKEIKVLLKGNFISTGRNKLGAIVGNKTKIGVNTSLMPGSLIGQESVIGPNVLVKGSIPDKSIFYDKHHGNFKNS